MFKSRLSLPFVLSLFALSSLGACSTMAELDMAMVGMPKHHFKGDSSVTTKFMDPREVAQQCSKIVTSKNALPSWYHACTYKKRNGDVVMIMPKPGSVSNSTYGKIFLHEYQHVGQAIQNMPMNHDHWH